MALEDLDPFDIFDGQAERLDRYFGTLSEEEWLRPSRCDGWTVRDVLAHLAGEEAYNHACLDGEVDALAKRFAAEGLVGFNEHTVRERRDLPVGDVLAEWREANGETRRRMRALGRDATLQTMTGPYPVGLQTFHYASELATHGDDVGAPAQGDMDWRVEVGLFALSEAGSKAEVQRDEGGYFTVRVPGALARMSPADFVEATVGRLPHQYPLDQRIRGALRCLA